MKREFDSQMYAQHLDMILDGSTVTQRRYSFRSRSGSQLEPRSSIEVISSEETLAQMTAARCGFTEVAELRTIRAGDRNMVSFEVGPSNGVLLDHSSGSLEGNGGLSPRPSR